MIDLDENNQDGETKNIGNNPDDHNDIKDSGQLSKDDNREINRALGLFTQLGFSMTACVVVGVFLGKYLDQWLGTSPWLLLVCSLLGAAASIKILYDLATKERD